MNILFLCPRIPYPPNKGDKIRSFNEIRYLSKKHEIFLGTTIEEESELKHISTLESYCRKVHAAQFKRSLKLAGSVFSGKPFSVSNFYDRSLQEFVDDHLGGNRIQAVICYCSSMAEYVFRNPRFQEDGLKGIKLIMDYVDLDSDKWHQYATYAKFPLSLVYMVENRRLFQYEIKINKTFHHSVFVSPREERVFKKLYPQARNITVIPNGIDFEYFAPPANGGAKRALAKTNGRGTLVFTGFMDYFANEDGVRWFCDRMFPRIRREFPDTEFYIVGNRPTNVVWNLSEIDGVTVTGYVDDIRKYYWMADVCVIPLRIARGLQNKVLEAMATGNAVVASTNASDGVICHNDSDIVITDDEERFAREVIALLKDKDRRADLSRNAVANIRAHYSWEENLKTFDDLLDDKIVHSNYTHGT